MAANPTTVVLVAIGLFVLAAPYLVNAVYQRRARRTADEMLGGEIAEFNRQVKANAVIVQARRGLWCLFFGSVGIASIVNYGPGGAVGLTAVSMVAALACLAFGIWGSKAELKRLKTFE